MGANSPPRAPQNTGVVVRLPDGSVLGFSTAFYIGREPGCDIQLDDVHVSRRHAEVSQLRGEWVIRDLQSSNGLFVDGARVDAAPIGDGVTARLGADGPELRIDPEAAVALDPAVRGEAIPQENTLLDEYAERYFGSEPDESVGGRTLMIRKAFQKVQQQQRRKHRWTVAVIVLVALSVAGYALYQQRLIRKHTQEAQTIFYQIKEMDVQLGRLEEMLGQSGNAAARQQVAQIRESRRAAERNYDSYVAQLYDRKLNEKDRLILRVTRIFGECEIAAPPSYVAEVKRYIEKWRSTQRFARAVKLAQEYGYDKRIAAEFISQGLPPQYFYLAMQESDFQKFRSGPPTNWGYAKGMWQFIPDTAKTYGLKVGPLFRIPQPDPEDERFHWEKATVAAAKYIKTIYTTDAQASGLLVMASYNWGERRVAERVKQLPDNPRDRNFWRLLDQYKIPDQTYDYVFHIVAAAVIGENPRLFGFQLDNPLAFAEQP